jgi:tight adherence protein B
VRLRLRRRRRLWTGLALAALVMPAPAAAGVHIASVDGNAYPEIRLTVVGSAPSSRPPVLTENGNRVFGLTAQNLGRGKAIVVALDRSRSMAGAPLSDATSAARAFVGLKASGDRVAVVAFGRRAVALTGFASGTTDAANALAGIAVDSRSGTALYDAVALAADRLAEEQLPGRVIVLLTDGDDVSSVATLDDAVAAARRARASVYPIAISGAGFDEAALRRLAAATGGSYHHAGSTALLAQVYRSIANELARTWRVGYTTAARPGEPLRLRATLRGLGAAQQEWTIPDGLGAGAVAAPPPSRLLPGFAYTALGTLAVGGASALLVALACGFLFAAGRSARLRARLDAHVHPQPGAKRRIAGAQQGLLTHLFRATENAFGNLRQFRSLQRLLERADLPIRASEFVYIQVGFGFLAGLLFAVVSGSPLLTLAAMAGGAFAPRGFAAFKARSRLKAFENQLPDLLITMAASLKAGHSFRQGLQTVVDEGHPPASDEFKRVLTETSLGRPMDDALGDMAERVGSRNLEFVLTAVTIQRQVGGSLASLFDMVADAVRQRQAFARKIRGLTSMGRMSAYVLVGLPVFLATMLTLMNRTYMSPLYHTSKGHFLIASGVVMMAIGSSILRKIVSFKG